MIKRVKNNNQIRVLTVAALAMMLASASALANDPVVVSGFAAVPDGTTTATPVLTVGDGPFVLTDVCAGVANGGWTFSGDSVGDFMRVDGFSGTCISVNGIALPAGETISCRPSFNPPDFGDAFCTVSGLQQED